MATTGNSGLGVHFCLLGCYIFLLYGIMKRTRLSSLFLWLFFPTARSYSPTFSSVCQESCGEAAPRLISQGPSAQEPFGTIAKGMEHT